MNTAPRVYILVAGRPSTACPPHSYVRIGAKGEKLRAWKGSQTLSAILAELAKAT